MIWPICRLLLGPTNTVQNQAYRPRPIVLRTRGLLITASTAVDFLSLRGVGDILHVCYCLDGAQWMYHGMMPQNRRYLSMQLGVTDRTWRYTMFRGLLCLFFQNLIGNGRCECTCSHTNPGIGGAFIWLFLLDRVLCRRWNMPWVGVVNILNWIDWCNNAWRCLCCSNLCHQVREFDKIW